MGGAKYQRARENVHNIGHGEQMQKQKAVYENEGDRTKRTPTTVVSRHGERAGLWL